MLFHHDPSHDDTFLEALGDDAREQWSRLGGGGPLALGREGDAFEVADMDSRPHGHALRVA
ncbi:MAG TPA: hypothetical protein VE449_00895 [Thermoleophilaceae bacterium]|nr:hypothetical protein [Thermoleophilaceae bacterium]